MSFTPRTVSPPPLWPRLWRRPLFKRGFYEVLGLLLLPRRTLRVLNCGYLAEDAPACALRPEEERERYGYHLYARLVRDMPLRDRDVLEVGCGRGGGARFLTRQQHPRSYLATDASWMLVAAGRGRQRPDGLRFRVARADRLPVRPQSVDIVVAVEAVHPLPDKARLLAELARVLRPGGVCLIADFFYTREDSGHALTRFRAAVADSPLRLHDEEDWTEPAIAALASDSPRRLAEIARYPRLLRPACLAFAGTVESPLYRQLCDGRAVYRRFVLVRD